MSEGICFFNHGTKHIARLVVAIHSLRKHWSGDVCILDSTPQAEAGTAAMIEKIVGDDRINVGLHKFEMRMLRRNSCYCCKAGLWRHSPFTRTLLCDSDVLFLKSPAPLLEMVADESNPGFVLTKFSDWNCAGRTISGRLAKWESVKCDDIDVSGAIANSRKLALPAVNTGICAWRNDTETRRWLELWERLTLAGWKNPWTDELAAQILVACVPTRLAPEIYNSSVLYAKDRENAAIRHHHGGKSLRPEDGGMWLAAYRECFAAGVAGIEKWGAATDPKLAGLAP